MYSSNHQLLEPIFKRIQQAMSLIAGGLVNYRTPAELTGKASIRGNDDR